MASKVISTLTSANNERILDTIHNNASLDYRNRIPTATDAGIDSVLKNLLDYRPHWNEFESALVNRIGTVIGRSKSWTNPLQEFKMGLLEWGDTIEEYQVGLLKAHNYNPDHDYMENALFGRELAEVQSNFHRLNREDFYKITVNEDLLRRAFLQDSGLAKFVSDLMNAPATSDNWDEFLLMTKLFTQYERMGGFHRIQIPEISDIDSTEAEAKRALRIIRSTAELVAFPSTHYNSAKMMSFASPDEMILFTTPGFRAAIDVEALAGAFNIDRADIPHRMITLPPDRIPADGCEAILTTKDFFIVADTKLENTSMVNPVNLHTNYFLHHWQIISASRFVPAIMFTTGPGDEIIEVSANITDITAITITDVEGEVVSGAIEPGMWYEVSATVTTEPANTENMAVTWTVSGNNSTKTQISQRGVLKVSPLETASTLTITAMDANGDKVADATYSITPSVEGKTGPDWPDVVAPPVITVQPTSTARASTNVDGTFAPAMSVTATGEDVGVNWQVATTETGDYVDIPDATNPTGYVGTGSTAGDLPPANAARWFRARVYTAWGDVFSTARLVGAL